MSNNESISQIRNRLLRAKLEALDVRIDRSQILCEILYGQLERQRKELKEAFVYVDEALAINPPDSAKPPNPEGQG
jgi:hypothetical protein